MLYPIELPRLVNGGHITRDYGSASKSTRRRIVLQTCRRRSTTPKADVEPRMMRTASVRGTADFAGARRPERFDASMKPVDGDDIVPYGGSGNIEAEDQLNVEIELPCRGSASVARWGLRPRAEVATKPPGCVDVRPGRRFLSR